MATHARLSLLTKPAPQEALQEAVDSFLRRGQARNLSASTLRFYRDRLGAFTRYLDSHGLHLGPEQVTAPVVRDFLTAEAERVTAATANHSRAALSAFFRFLVSDEVIPADHMTKV
ncbi:MAG: site-specific integrase, partial [Armatimonadetes bacterium]|nr:site-specific integrase [Armatimonadota bacterium]